MTDKALLEKALRALEVFYKLSPAPTLLELMEEISERIDTLNKKDKYASRKGSNNVRWNRELTIKFDQAKALRAAGLRIKDACVQAGITENQWYWRKSIDTRKQ